MNIHKIKTISGPNVYHHKPVLIMTLDLGVLSEQSSADLEGFTERLVELLPGLQEHRCSPGYPGGFVERLNRGTYLAHIVEHVALELSSLAGIGVGYGKTIYAGQKGLYHVIVRFRSEKGMKSLLRSAVDIAQAVINKEPYDLIPTIARAQRWIAREALGPSTQAIVSAAEKRSIPWRRLNHQNLVQLGYGRARKLIQATTSSLTSDIAVRMAQDKDFTKVVLREARIPVPQGEVIEDLEDAQIILTEWGGPLVVKPCDGNHGNGVSLNIHTPVELESAMKLAQTISHRVIIEEQFIGRDFRLVVVNGKLVAAALREPAHVIGDGHSSVFQLIQKENSNPLRGDGHEKALTKIVIDDACQAFLKRSQLSLEFVPPHGKVVYLRETANLSTGGVARDVTEQVHPSIRMLAERAARTIGLDICGIDMVATEINRPLSPEKEGIIEINAGPGIRMHHFPSEGLPRDVGGAIVDHLFKDTPTGRIPIFAITGTNGKTTVTRLIAHLFSGGKQTVGVTTSDGIYINGVQVSSGDHTGPSSARVVLSDPGVDIAVLETARGGLIKRGLGFDWADVSVITNIQSDHIGQDGIETLDDILRIKSLLAERVRSGGTVVLNYDDPYLRSLGEKIALFQKNVHVSYFSTHGESPGLMKYAAEGKSVYFYHDHHLWEIKDGIRKFITSAQLVPMTFRGTAKFQIENALAGVAAARAHGLPITEVAERLGTFATGHENRGRVNLYQVHRGYVLLDYGHNPKAIESVAEMVAPWGATRVTAVVTSPGDRSDDLIRSAGVSASRGFDHLLVREDHDLRGRAPGEVARLFCEGAHESNPSILCETVLDPIAALDQAIREMENGELVVYFYEKMDEIVEVLKQWNAIPVNEFVKSPEFAVNPNVRPVSSPEFSPEKRP